jgi:hypothetical protein
MQHAAESSDERVGYDCCTVELVHGTHLDSRTVGADHDVWIEHDQQPFELATPTSRQKRSDDFSVAPSPTAVRSPR